MKIPAVYMCHGYGSGIRQQFVSTGYKSYCWDGYSFLPTYCYQGWDNTESFCVNTPSLLNAHTTYNHTNYYPGHESIFHWTYFCFTDCFCGTMYHRFYDPEGNLVSTYSYDFDTCIAPDWYSQTWFWAGWGMNNASCNEIWMNGTYCSVIEAGTTGLTGFTDCAVVCCLDTCRLCRYGNDKGSVWVEGQNMWFISGWSWEQCIINDGNNYGNVGSEYAGNVWVGSGNYLEYIDQTGIHRRTHVGDPWGIDGSSHCCCCNVGAANKGFTWDRDNWAFLYFINCDGLMIRLGNGFIYGNGP